MAYSTVQPAIVCPNTTMMSLDRQVIELSLSNNREDADVANSSSCSPSSGPCKPRPESLSPIGIGGSSAISRRPRSQESAELQTKYVGNLDMSGRFDLSRSPGSMVTDDSSQKLFTRKSRAGTYVIEKDLMKYSMDTSASVTPTSRVAALGDTMKALMNAADSYSKSACATYSEGRPEGKSDFSTTLRKTEDYSRYLSNSEGATDFSKISSLSEHAPYSDTNSMLRELGITKHGDTNNQYSTTHYKANDEDSKPAAISETQKNLSDSDSPNAVSDRKATDSDSALTRSKDFDFTSTDLGTRLKYSVQSTFLANEFNSGSASDNETASPAAESKEIRSIDDILKQYGIPTNMGNSNTNMPSAVRMNLSSNQDSFSPSAGAKDSARSFASNADSIPTSSVSYDTKSASTIGVTRQLNLSQNNETTSKSSSSPENDSLRKFGSSVDFKNASAADLKSAASKYSSYGRYDYGKGMAVVGDNPYSTMNITASTTKYGSFDSKQFENSMRATPSLPGKWVSMTENSKPSDPLAKPVAGEASTAVGSNFEMTNGMGSPTDALEHSLYQERQRLRNITSMISTTPIQSTLPSRPYSSTFLSRETTRSYGPGELEGRRLYSGSTLTTSSLHSSELSHRPNWSLTLDQRDPTAMLGKSVSMPAYNTGTKQSASRTGSSVDASYYNTSTNYRPSQDQQFNNSIYSPGLAGMLTTEQRDRDADKSLKKGMAEKKEKPECPFKNKFKKANSTVVARSPATSQAKGAKKAIAGSSYTNNVRFETNSATGTEGKRYASKSAPRNAVNMNGPRSKDYNVGKTPSAIINGFDFARDLNRMWQQAVLGTEPKENPKPKPPKYQPYKPQGKKYEETVSRPNSAVSGRGLFSNGPVQSYVRKSQSCWAADSSGTSSRPINRYDVACGSDSLLGCNKQCAAVSNHGGDKKKPTKSKRPASAKSMAPANSAPKSILKNSASKVSMARPQSALGSKSYTKSLFRSNTSTDSFNYSSPMLTPTTKKLEMSFRKTTPTSSITSTMKKGRKI